MIHFEFLCNKWGLDEGWLFGIQISNCSNTTYWKDCLYHWLAFAPFSKISHNCVGLFLDSIPLHCSMSFSSPIPHHIHYCNFIVSLQIGWCESSNLILFQNGLSYFSSFTHVNSRISLSISTKKKNPARILTNIELNIQINLRSDIFTQLTFPLHEHYVFQIYMIYFISIL